MLLNEMPKKKFAAIAFSDVHSARLELVKAKFDKDGAAFKNYREMLASDEIDASVIANP